MGAQQSQRFANRADIIADIRGCQVLTVRMRCELAEHVHVSRKLIDDSRELMAQADRLLDRCRISVDGT